MPTLLEKDKIVIQKWYKPIDKKFLEEQPAIKFILRLIEERITIKNNPPKIKPTCAGSKVLIIRAKTGSGKSTIMPTAIYNEFYEQNHKGVLVTQPTRITTMEIPYDIVKWNKNLKLGENIGYQTGITARKPAKGILFCTTGILLQFLKTLTDEQIMAKYGFIVLDEVHQRSIDLDMTLFHLKQFLMRCWKEKNCPLVILTSGTFDEKIYMNYFDCPKENFVDVMGFSYEITDYYSKFDIGNFLIYITELIQKINASDEIKPNGNKTNHDILVFVQGSAQIKALVEKVNYLNYLIYTSNKSNKHNKIYMSNKHNKSDKPNKSNKIKKPAKKGKGEKLNGELNNKLNDEKLNNKLNGKLNDEKINESSIPYMIPIALMSENISRGSKEYIDIFSPIETVTHEIYEFKDEKQTDKILEHIKPQRRVILGTNAVETGITLETLKFVIDSGYRKDVQYNPQFNCSVMIDCNVTKANSMQRRGRVGRNTTGDFYPCYTKETFDALDPLPLPEIVKGNITNFLLNILIQTTVTTIEEVSSKHRSDKAFQKNQFDQNWYEMQHGANFDVEQLDMLQPPSAESMCSSFEILHGLGFITHEYLPTLIGYYGSKFRKIKLENVRMIIAGYHHFANILDLITITAFLQLQNNLGIKKYKYKPQNPLIL